MQIVTEPQVVTVSKIVQFFFVSVLMSNTSIGYQLFTFTDTYSTTVHRYRAGGRYENPKGERVVMVNVICPPGSNRVTGGASLPPSHHGSDGPDIVPPALLLFIFFGFH